jgi:hypothetical protein
MFEDEHIAFSSDKDFSNNRYHLLYKEGLNNRNEPTRVYFFDWHQSYLWSNSGGSHHAVALIRQMGEQKREFRFPVNLTRYSFDLNAFQGLEHQYHLFVSSEQCLKSDPYYGLSLFFCDNKIPFAMLPFSKPHQSLRIYCIPKEQLGSHQKIIEQWLVKMENHGSVINFFKLINRHFV